MRFTNFWDEIFFFVTFFFSFKGKTTVAIHDTGSVASSQTELHPGEGVGILKTPFRSKRPTVNPS